jgi:Leu/Phe-tRNA-protein transferase
MSDKDFVLKWKHELRGMILDTAIQNAKGAERSLELRQLEVKIDSHLRQMVHDLREGMVPDEPHPANPG